MNRVCLLLLIVSCVFTPAFVHAQEPELPSIKEMVIECGQVVLTNTSHQFGDFAWLEYIVETRRSLNTCPVILQTDAWVSGIDGSALSRTGIFSASARRQVPVPPPVYRRWQTSGRHWLIVAIFGWFELGNTASFATINPPPPQREDPEFECEVMQSGRWVGGTCELPNCPLIVDTAHDGYRLTSVEDGVRFDLNADGVAEQVAWTRRDSDDAFLVMDRNGNGQIDDGTELFGNFTPVFSDGSDVTAPNGFEALRFGESPSHGPSYPDRQIDRRDAIYGQLMLWRDRNHNGISEPGELEPLAHSGIVAIDTDYKRSRRVDRFGNEFRQRGRVIWKGGGADDLYDVWLQWRD
jgi:hypothetical protein